MAKSKQNIQTNLLGKRVTIGDETGTVSGPSTSVANQEGEIVTVYHDRHGDLKYTIDVDNPNVLVDLYSCSFTMN